VAVKGILNDYKHLLYIRSKKTVLNKRYKLVPFILYLQTQ